MKKGQRKIYYPITITIFLFLFFVGISPLWAGSCGDVDSNGRIDIADALMIAKYIVSSAYNNMNFSVSDVNEDGKTDVIDSLFISQYYVGIIETLPGCQVISTPEPVKPGDVFHSVWDTRNTQRGSSSPNQIKLPVKNRGTSVIRWKGNYNFQIDWGDGSVSHINNSSGSSFTHSYSKPGIYHLKITGEIKGFSFLYRPGGYPFNQKTNSGDSLKLLEIRSWGPLQLSNSGYQFHNAKNLIITAQDKLDLTGVTNLKNTFENCKNLKTIPGIEYWDLSKVVDMNNMFQGASSFNSDIGNWDV